MRMLVCGLVVGLCLVLPSALLLWLLRTRAATRGYFLSLVALIAVVLFVLTFSTLGAWYVVGRFWPALFGIAFGAILLQRVREGLPEPWLPERWSWELLLTGVNVATAAAFCLVLPLLWQARAYEGEPLELASPLRGARYSVMGGGANASVNHHAFIPAQRYALDLIQLNAFGVRAAGISPDELDEYAVFGDEVVAPCAGEIVSAENGMPNRALMDPDVDHRAGNHVVIFCNEHSVLLAHLQMGTVAVAVGDRVRIGQTIGKVGNSGSTMEPHLHIHAVPGRHAEAQQSGSALLDRAAGAPLLIDGRFLIKGDLLGLVRSP